MIPTARGRYRRGVLVESPEHISAKNRLARWLTKAAGNPPAYQVVVEYPFSDCGDPTVPWSVDGYTRKPTRAQLKARNNSPIYIGDIALIEDDRITTVIEVVKTSYPAPWKVSWLREHGIAVYWADTEVVLSIVSTPMSLNDILQEVP